MLEFVAVIASIYVPVGSQSHEDNRGLGEDGADAQLVPLILQRAKRSRNPPDRQSPKGTFLKGGIMLCLVSGGKKYSQGVEKEDEE